MKPGWILTSAKTKALCLGCQESESTNKPNLQVQFWNCLNYQWNRKSSCFTSAAAPGSLHSQLWPGMRRIMKECICYSIHVWSSPCQSHRLSWTHSHSDLKDSISTQTSQKYRFFSSLSIPGCQHLPDTHKAEKLLKCRSRMEQWKLEDVLHCLLSGVTASPCSQRRARDLFIQSPQSPLNCTEMDLKIFHVTRNSQKSP